jgi:hypothetical protein
VSRLVAVGPAADLVAEPQHWLARAAEFRRSYRSCVISRAADQR